MPTSAVASLTTPGVLVTLTPTLLMYSTSRWSKPTPALETTFSDGSKASSDGLAGGRPYHWNRAWILGPCNWGFWRKSLWLMIWKCQVSTERTSSRIPASPTSEIRAQGFSSSITCSSGKLFPNTNNNVMCSRQNKSNTTEKKCVRVQWLQESGPVVFTVVSKIKTFKHQMCLKIEPGSKFKLAKHRLTNSLLLLLLLLLPPLSWHRKNN